MATSDEDVADVLGYIPGGGILDDLGGFSARAAKRAAAKARQQQQAELDRRRGLAPTTEELTAQYAMGDPNQYLLGTSAASQADQGVLGSQNSALSAMQDVYNQHGMTDQDRAYMQQAQEQNARALRSQGEAMQQNLAERGMGSSGSSISAMLAQQGQLANANAGMAANVNYNAQNRALQAMQGAGNLSSEMQNQAFSRGTAADRFTEANARRRQDVTDQNTRTTNAMEDSRIGARQQTYSNEVDTSRDQMGLYGADQEAAQKRREEAEARKRGLEGKAVSTVTGGSF